MGMCVQSSGGRVRLVLERWVSRRARRWCGNALIHFSVRSPRTSLEPEATQCRRARVWSGSWLQSKVDGERTRTPQLVVGGRSTTLRRGQTNRRLQKDRDWRHWKRLQCHRIPIYASQLKDDKPCVQGPASQWTGTRKRGRSRSGRGGSESFGKES